MKNSFVKLIKMVAMCYKFIAVLLFNIIVLFTLINMGFNIYVDYKNKRNQVNNPVEQKYGIEPLFRVYPYLNKKEIDDLLRETWNRPYIFESWTGLKERTYRGEYVNVDKNGYRLTKDQGPWPPNRQKYFTIFLFGGSTTFGYGLPDWQTVASYLQNSLSMVGLKKEIKIYNFGRGYYYLPQERILFEQLITSNFIPDMAIFIDGLNDFGFSYGDWQFSPRFKLLFEQQLSKPEEYYQWRMLMNKIPMLRHIYMKKIEKVQLVDKENSIDKIKTAKSQTYKEVKNIINRYAQNKKIIDAIGTSFGVKTIFVWQPASFYKYNKNCHLFYQPPDPRGILGYKLMDKFKEEYPLGDNFLWCADIQENIHVPLYVDNVHYSALMSRILAHYIVELLKMKELLPIEYDD